MLFVDLIFFTSKTKQPSEKLCHSQVLVKQIFQYEKENPAIESLF